MNKMPIAIVVSLVAGFAAAALVLQSSDSNPASQSAHGSTSHFDETVATEERIRALEAAVSEERRARQLLEEELQILFAELDDLEASLDERAGAGEQQVRADAEAVRVFERFRGGSSNGSRRDDLIAAGLGAARADWILQRESELRFESMQARFEARNSDNPTDWNDASLNPEAMLRAEIGDAEYELYLESNNRPTSVNISSVMASSPGENAGLRPGDEIVSYDGRRVFSTWELVQQTMGGGGEGTVVVDVMRDGAPMQIVLPRARRRRRPRSVRC